MSFTSVIVNDLNYEGLNPVQFGFENCEKSHSFGPAIRTHWLIHYVVSGYGTFKIKDKEYRLGAGEMFIIPPYVETYYEADSKNPWEYIWVGFTAGETLPIPLPDIIRCPEAFHIFTSMKNSKNFTNGRSAYLSSKLWELFALLLDNEIEKTDYIQTALDCIHSEYMKPITIEDIANRLNLDRRYFSHLFKKKTGISPKEYLLNYRMNIASSLLLSGGVSVTVASCSVGYSDVFQFSKMFKRHFGFSPTMYIKQMK